jgi:hypothetical protein
MQGITQLGAYSDRTRGIEAMQDDLDALLAKLAGRAAPSQTNLEARVWAKIGARQRDLSPAALWGWRSAAAALVLLLGVAAEAATSAQAAPELALFTSLNALAPSTLLGETR